LRRLAARGTRLDLSSATPFYAGMAERPSEPLQQFGGIEPAGLSAHRHWGRAQLVQPPGHSVPVGNVVDE
jgi:hypothetical protein